MVQYGEYVEFWVVNPELLLFEGQDLGPATLRVIGALVEGHLPPEEPAPTPDQFDQRIIELGIGHEACQQLLRRGLSPNFSVYIGCSFCAHALDHMICTGCRRTYPYQERLEPRGLPYLPDLVVRTITALGHVFESLPPSL